MKTSLPLFSLIGACMMAMPNAQALNGDPKLGKIKAPSCVFCHGKNGVATNSAYPNLAGQSPQYLYSAMKDYQQGLRQGPNAKMMQVQLSKLTDQDLRDVATFFASPSSAN